jgi:hypothetical protein
MLNTLNDEQILGIAECRDKWIKVGLQTGPVDREAAVVAVNKAYKCAGLQPPKEVVFCTSPLDMDEKIRAASNNEHKFISSYGFANCWSGWAAFVDYFATYTDVQNLEIFEGLRDLSYNCGFVSFFDTTCFISERPEYIKMDDTGRTHCENGPAIQYADGFEVYIWHGVRIPKSHRLVRCSRSISQRWVRNGSLRFCAEPGAPLQSLSLLRTMKVRGSTLPWPLTLGHTGLNLGSTSRRSGRNKKTKAGENPAFSLPKFRGKLGSGRGSGWGSGLGSGRGSGLGSGPVSGRGSCLGSGQGSGWGSGQGAN